eukprot:765910-Amphidinium_carterae.1
MEEEPGFQQDADKEWGQGAIPKGAVASAEVETSLAAAVPAKPQLVVEQPTKGAGLPGQVKAPPVTKAKAVGKRPPPELPAELQASSSGSEDPQDELVLVSVPHTQSEVVTQEDEPTEKVSSTSSARCYSDALERPADLEYS